MSLRQFTQVMDADGFDAKYIRKENNMAHHHNINTPTNTPNSMKNNFPFKLRRMLNSILNFESIPTNEHAKPHVLCPLQQHISSSSEA